ncbi:MAG: hypothetical protein ACREJM_02330 [Candidatus Saccharimonadales bacterium]
MNQHLVATPPNQPFHTGQRVRVKSTGKVGTIIGDLFNDKACVLTHHKYGDRRYQVKFDNLEAAPDFLPAEET